MGKLTSRLLVGRIETVAGKLERQSVDLAVTSPPYFAQRMYGDAEKHKDQLGLEKTVGEYVDRMVAACEAFRPLLKETATLIMVLGDKRANDGCGPSSKGGPAFQGRRLPPRPTANWREAGVRKCEMIGVPWMFAFAMRAAGWRIAAKFPWIKRNGMPASGGRRPGATHEEVFIFSLAEKYYFDRYACMMPTADGKAQRFYRDADLFAASLKPPHGLIADAEGEILAIDESVARSGGTHFATYPEWLIEPLVKQFAPCGGVCSACGTPFERDVVKTTVTRARPRDYVKRTGAPGTGNRIANSAAGVKVEMKGWLPACKCKAEAKPAVVLDPFLGSGTTGVVALREGCSFVGVELVKAYAEEAAARISKFRKDSGK